MTVRGIWEIRFGGTGINFTCEVIASTAQEALKNAQDHFESCRTIRNHPIISVTRRGTSYSFDPTKFERKAKQK